MIAEPEDVALSDGMRQPVETFERLLGPGRLDARGLA
jgi:hypothetical protein